MRPFSWSSMALTDASIEWTAHTAHRWFLLNLNQYVVGAMLLALEICEAECKGLIPKVQQPPCLAAKIPDCCSIGRRSSFQNCFVTQGLNAHLLFLDTDPPTPFCLSCALGYSRKHWDTLESCLELWTLSPFLFRLPFWCP